MKGPFIIYSIAVVCVTSLLSWSYMIVGNDDDDHYRSSSYYRGSSSSGHK